MSVAAYPFDFTPNAYGTNLKFGGEEDARWYVEVNVETRDALKRIRLTFIGAVQARVNDDYDCEAPMEKLLVKLDKSPWLDAFFDSYVKSTGAHMLSIVDDIRHYVVHGHDLTIGILASDVKWTETEK